MAEPIVQSRGRLAGRAYRWSSGAAPCAALLLSLIYSAVPAMGMQRAWSWCEVGAKVVVTSGVSSSSPRVQGSYPACTVTVYLTGTTTLATIYSDNSATPLANPFTASNLGFWFFYASNGRYDVRISGGTPPSLATPFTFSDIYLFDEAVNWVDVAFYGCAANGSTDDSTCITNALAALHASSSKTLFLAPGTYKSSTPLVLRSGEEVVCYQTGDRWRSGVHPVLFDYRGTGAAVKLISSAAQNPSNVTIRGCQFDGRNVNGSVDGLLMQANAGSAD